MTCLLGNFHVDDGSQLQKCLPIDDHGLLLLEEAQTGLLVMDHLALVVTTSTTVDGCMDDFTLQLDRHGTIAVSIKARTTTVIETEEVGDGLGDLVHGACSLA
jgi:hypothetical protein